MMVATLVAVVLYPHMVVKRFQRRVGVCGKPFWRRTVLDPRRLKNEGQSHFAWTQVISGRPGLQALPSPTTQISDGELTRPIIVRFGSQRAGGPVLHQADGPS